MKKINILETTLRDGSYAIDFSFTAKDTEIICKELETAGFEYIEIGHGLGLNASNTGHGKAVQTDEEYLKAAQKVVTKAKYGMFCIPGIAELEDIDMAAHNGMQFIRIGTNVTETEQSEKFIQRAKKYGMFVAANFMKSYAMAPKEFAQKVKQAEEFGADMVYLVDSAGGMFPSDIREYHRHIREVSNMSLGFHGHNNLDLAVANSLEAVELGFDFVDTSLQGLGRSAGNASTEMTIAALLKKGHQLPINFLHTLTIGQKYIRPRLPNNGIDSLDIIAGYTDFHSSYMPRIEKYSQEFSINPAYLIIEASKVDKVHVEEKTLEHICQKFKNESTAI